MKVAVSSEGKGLEAPIDSRFGRCSYFVIVETDDMSFEVFENESAALSGSAGVQSSSFVASKGVKAVLTGNCGPKAAQVFSSAGIDVHTGHKGIVKDAVIKFKKGALPSKTGNNVPEKYGINGHATGQDQTYGAGSGRGMGMGGGRGMGGCGGGRGMGGGGGRGMGGCGGGMGMGRRMAVPEVPQKNASGGSREEELAVLKEQAASLESQMKAIEARIKALK